MYQLLKITYSRNRFNLKDILQVARVFRELESPNELSTLREVSSSLLQHRHQYLLQLQNVSTAPLQYLDLLLQTYEKSAKEAVERGLEVPPKPEDLPDNHAKWNYLHAIFFASTVLTTIGYGNIAPETVGGRVFCMLFALIGIPLCVSVLADLGQLLAASLPRLPRPPLRSPALKSLATAALLVALLILYLSVGAVLFMVLENEWTFLDSFYFCLITMTTIGFGDLVPQKAEYMLLCTIYILLGLSITSTIIEAVRLEYEESWKRLQALAEALRRIGEGTADSQTLRRDLGDIINIITDKDRPDWEATVNTIVTNIQPKQKKPKMIEIIIYETSV